MSFIKKISFLLIYTVLALPFVGFWLGGWYNYISFLILFSVIPLMDFWLQDTHNPSTEEENILLEAFYFKAIIVAYVPLQILALISALYLVTYVSLTWYAWFGFALSMGLVTGGLGINLAHELMHRRSKSEQLLSKILLSLVCYGHFFIEHVRGHHLNVATPSDPASARLNESFYQFLPRCIKGSFLSAWKIERNRLKRQNINFYSYQNQFWWIVTVPVFLLASCFLLGGFSAALFFVIQAITAIIILELVNYVEHYGLERKKLANGYYERVTPAHSWNANHWASNAILLHLQRHSDHHANGGRHYQILRHMEQSPQLPSGYLAMMMLALCPPLWRAVMNKRVAIYRTQPFNDTSSQVKILANG